MLLSKWAGEGWAPRDRVSDIRRAVDLACDAFVGADIAAMRTRSASGLYDPACGASSRVTVDRSPSVQTEAAADEVYGHRRAQSVPLTESGASSVSHGGRSRTPRGHSTRV